MMMMTVYSSARLQTRTLNFHITVLMSSDKERMKVEVVNALRKPEGSLAPYVP